jgi:hypothetical protein
MSTISKKHFYAAQGVTSLAVSIAVGDCVIVLTSTQNSSYVSGLADNGSSGGNAYTLYNQNSNCGYSSLYYCAYATKAATSISFNSTSSPVIAVIIYSNSTGVPIKIGALANSGNSGSGGSTISAGAISSTSPNSVLVTMLSWWNASAGVSISAGAGCTLEGTVQPSVVSGVLVGMGAIDQACATVASYTNSANTSGGNASYQGTWTLELIPLTINNYLGKTVPQICLPLKLWDIPSYAGSGGGGSPVTPVPIGVQLKGGTTGLAYSETITAQGGSGGYTYTLLSGALPTGLSLAGSTGIISGTPTVAGSFSFTIKVTDSALNTGTQSFTIVISAPAGAGGSFPFLS